MLHRGAMEKMILKKGSVGNKEYHKSSHKTPSNLLGNALEWVATDISV